MLRAPPEGALTRWYIDTCERQTERIDHHSGLQRGSGHPAVRRGRDLPDGAGTRNHRGGQPFHGRDGADRAAGRPRVPGIPAPAPAPGRGAGAHPDPRLRARRRHRGRARTHRRRFARRADVGGARRRHLHRPRRGRRDGTGTLLRHAAAPFRAQSRRQDPQTRPEGGLPAVPFPVRLQHGPARIGVAGDRRRSVSRRRGPDARGHRRLRAHGPARHADPVRTGHDRRHVGPPAGGFAEGLPVLRDPLRPDLPRPPDQQAAAEDPDADLHGHLLSGQGAALPARGALAHRVNAKRPRAGARGLSCGGGKGTRTPNPLLAKQMRYQLRHAPARGQSTRSVSRDQTAFSSSVSRHFR